MRPLSVSGLNLNCSLTSNSATVVIAVCGAVGLRRRVRFNYGGRDRVVEPYLCGRDRHGNDLLTAWQVEGASSSGPPQGWRTYRLDQVFDLEVLGDRFGSPRPGFVSTDDRMSFIHCQFISMDT